jgi:hypothetical protein
MTPALFTSTSNRPYRRVTNSASASTSEIEAMSQRLASTLGWVALSACSVVSLRPQATTLAPSATNRSTKALPIPELPPVTNTIRSR